MPMRRVESQLAFQLVQQQVNEHHVCDALGLGEHDGVQLVSGTGDHFDDVVVAPLGFHVVDTHTQGARFPVEAVQRLDDLTASGRFGAGCHGILQIEKHMIQFQACRFGHHLFRTAGHRQLAAAWRVFGLLTHGFLLVFS